MRLAFFGSGVFGEPTLRDLAGDGHDMIAVVTQPDRPAGRGGAARATPIADVAESLGLPTLKPETPNSAAFAAELAAMRLDLAVVVAYGHLISRDLLALPRLGFVNLHASLLPAYRGAAPVPWAILSGETVSGATVFRLNPRFDEGDILGQIELPIDKGETAGGYLERLAPAGGGLMRETVRLMAAGKAAHRTQQEHLASKAPKLKKEDGCLEWHNPYAVLDRQVRAFQPWPLAFTALPGAKGPVRVNVLELEPAEGFAGGQPFGTILSADPVAGLVVQAGDMPVRLARFQPQGKKPMTDREFLRGTKIVHGPSNDAASRPAAPGERSGGPQGGGTDRLAR